MRMEAQLRALFNFFVDNMPSDDLPTLDVDKAARILWRLDRQLFLEAAQCADFVHEGDIAAEVAAEELRGLAPHMRRYTAREQYHNLDDPSGACHRRISLTSPWEFVVVGEPDNFRMHLTQGFPGVSRVGHPEAPYYIIHAHSGRVLIRLPDLRSLLAQQR